MSDADTAPDRSNLRTLAHTLRLILGNQLNARHSWFNATDAGVVYVLMEVREETDYVLHHAQKILAIFAAMRAFAAQLRKAGHRVRYVAIDNPSNRHSIPANLDALMAHYRASHLQYQPPEEWRLDEALQQWGARQPFAAQMADSEHFLTRRDEVAACFSVGGQWRMEVCYRRMRRRHGILLDASGAPEGGRWNFDHDNRAPWPGDPPAPQDWRTAHDHSALWRSIEAAGVRSFGAPNAGALPWPLDRDEALQHLEAFVTHALPHFGRYEDAMSPRSPRLFHSLLSFALNVKLLHPREVIARAEAAWRVCAAGVGGRVYPPDSGLARIHARRVLVADARLCGIESSRSACTVAALVMGWADRHALPGRCDRQFAGQRACAPHPAADGDRQFRAAGGAGSVVTASLVPGRLYRCVRVGGTAQYGRHEPVRRRRPARQQTVCQRRGLYRPHERLLRRLQVPAQDPCCAQACPYNALCWDFLARQRPLLEANERLAMPYRQLDRMAPEVLEGIQTQAAHWRANLDVL